DHLLMPRPGRMRADDGQAGKVGGQGIQVNRTSVVQLDAHTTWRTCSQTVGAGMEEGRNTQLLNFLHQGIKLRVIRIESLDARMEFRARQPQVFDGAFDFFDGYFSFVRVNAGKADKLLR